MILAKFRVEESVVKAGARRIGGAGSVVDSVEPRPVGGSEAHGAGLATGVELAAGESKGSESFGGGANGVDLGVRGGIVGSGDGVGALANDLAVAHDDRAKRPARAGSTFCVASAMARRRNSGLG